jgi:NAD(P)-dependent dehydrogenase (short-subunit alcohol dehydrogenase family)
LAHKIARKKPQVIVIVDVNAANGTKVVQEVSSKHGINAVFKQIDLSKMEQVKDMILSTVKECGRLDVREHSIREFPEI